MAFDCFLKIDTISGESTDDKHKDWIEVLSYNHGLSQPGSGSSSSGGARSAERCDHQDFSIVKGLDKASPKLALACCNGEHIASIKMALCRAAKDKGKYMEYVLSDVIVSSVHPCGTSKGGTAAPIPRADAQTTYEGNRATKTAKGGSSLPIEEVTFNYGKIEWVYTETDHKTGKPKGDIKAHWDLTANKGG